eukprot:TRINITY_DN2796_c0_g1_i11.p1 TRINITY_DN2796_c0_g1~~TRINITY_DN2796_c0_g1_i11.p1  ORF type:complete len:681 (+),score=93.00 TRINITY_DN2796_c0_g1_i11:430-2472(+)
MARPQYITQYQKDAYCNVTTDGVPIFTTCYDYGGACIYGVYQPNEEEWERYVYRTMAVDNVMKSFYNHTGNVVMVYYVTMRAVLCKIYPYIPDLAVAMGPHSPLLGIPPVVESDRTHNPNGDAFFSSLYLDLTGAGWMVTAAQPIYRVTNQSVPEMVVCADVLVKVLVDKYLTGKMIPFDGSYGILASTSGQLIAVPKQGIHDLGLESMITVQGSDEYNFDTQNINLCNVSNAKELCKVIRCNNSGVNSHAHIGESVKVLTWSYITSTKWMLFIIVERTTVYHSVNRLVDNLTIGAVLVAVIIVAVIILLSILFFWQSRSMSKKIGTPLNVFSKMLENIGTGSYVQEPPHFSVDELNRTAQTLSAVGKQLGTNVEKLKALNDAYSRFIPSAFIETLGKQDVVSVKLGDCSQCEMTILFADIRGFTQISEQMSPTELFNYLNTYMQYVGPVVTKNGGFIDKYIGDGVMSLFPNCAADAIRCSTDILVAVQSFNETIRDSRHRMQVGIGIHTGPGYPFPHHSLTFCLVILGTIGFENRMDATVIADSVNVASRLEGLTKQFKVPIIVSDFTLRQVNLSDIGVESQYLGHVCLKGKKIPLPVHALWSCSDPVVFTDNHLVEALRQFESGHFQDCLDMLRKIDRSTSAECVDALSTVYEEQCVQYMKLGCPLHVGSTPLLMDVK